ncbi:NTP/NDP exchange transporter [Aliikangiella sp. IMCC44653]
MFIPQSIKQTLQLAPKDLKIVFLSASYFFLLLTAYYILRPVRETFGISRSAEDLPYLFLSTMCILLILAPAIGWLVASYKRKQFIPIVYRGVSFCLILFCIALTAFESDYLFYTGVTFYVWLSVINMLLISLFWGFIADGISFSQSKNYFPAIALGGTLGAILGGTITNTLVSHVTPNLLILIPIIFLELALLAMGRLDKLFDNQTINDAPKTSNNLNNKLETTPKIKQAFEGISYALSSPYLMAIAGYIFLYGLTSTFLYFQQGELIASASTSQVQRTQYFSQIDIWSNVLTLIFQLYISQKLLNRWSIGAILVGLPLLTLTGFISLAIFPTLSVLMVFQVLRRSLNYGLFKPAREALFTLIPSQQKYKAKSFVDSFIYRGGDAVGALTQNLLNIIGISLVGLASLVAPLSLIWCLLALFLGKRVKLLASQTTKHR